MRPVSVALLVTICQNYHCDVTCACRPERNWDFRPENADLLKIDVHARPAPRARRPTPDKYNIGARSILLARGPMLRVLPTDAFACTRRHHNNKEGTMVMRMQTGLLSLQDCRYGAGDSF